MDAKLWNKPVEVELGRIGHFRAITSTREAAECLLTRWPESAGPAHAAARRACLAVLEGKAEPEVARQAFIDAAEESGIFVRS